MTANPSANIRQSDIDKLKTYLVGLINRELDANPIQVESVEERKKIIQEYLKQSYASTKVNLPATYRDQLFHDIGNEILGYGIIQTLLDDPDINDIMINGKNNIYIEKFGKLIKTNISFESDDQIIKLIDRIILPLGRHIDADNPTVDARLPDGSRVNAIIQPCSIDGPTLTIRKFKKDKLKTEQLIQYGTMTQSMAEFVRACVISRFNILISGGTGSGKTTTLNVFSSYVPEDERIITIEDAAELQLQQDHVIRLESKPANIEGKHAVTIRELVKNSLRMRPERIIVGECRGGEALDMLQAMNTGHDGSMTTVHANSPRDAIARLETLCLMSGMDLPVVVIRKQIASAIDLVIQQTRLKDGSRKITSITEVAGMEGDTVVMTDIFKFEQTGISKDGKVEGELKATGIRPQFTPRLEAAGFKLGPEVFGANLASMLSGAPRRH